MVQRSAWMAILTAIVLVSACDGDDPVPLPEEPVLESLEPAAGPTRGGLTLTLTGHSFGVEPVATFGEVPMVLTSAGEREILAVLPEGEGSADVRVEADGLSSSSATFSYEPPSIETIEPASALVAGGTTLTIHGRNFGRTPEVTVEDEPAEVESSSHEQAIVTSPEGAPGAAAVVLRAGDQASDAFLLTYECPDGHEERDGECVRVGGGG